MRPRRTTYEVLSFVRHLGRYYRQHARNVARLYQADLPGNAIFIDRDHYIVPPQSSSVTHAVWLHHTSSGDGSREDRIFRGLRAGRHSFLDLGAAEGYYSAQFAATAERPSRIVAVDLSPAMCRLHAEVAEANRRLSQYPLDWCIRQVAITDAEKATTLGAGLDGKSFSSWYDTDPGLPVQTARLTDFLREVDFVPDLIKIDIESFEYEVVMSSLDYLAESRPRLHFELHTKMMRERGKSPERLMEHLLRHYQVVGAVPYNWKAADLSRIGLVPL